MRPTPYVASLRIYEPLSAFEPADRLRWQSIDIDATSYVFEETLALRRLVFPEPPAGRPDGVHPPDPGLRSPPSLGRDCAEYPYRPPRHNAFASPGIHRSDA